MTKDEIRNAIADALRAATDDYVAGRPYCFAGPAAPLYWAVRHMLAEAEQEALLDEADKEAKHKM